MPSKHFRFFDSQGNLMEPDVSSGVPSINIRFDRISTGLFESELIWIMEEVLDSPYGSDVRYVRPRTRMKDDEEGYFLFAWKSKENDDNIFLYEIDNSTESKFLEQGACGLKEKFMPLFVPVKWDSLVVAPENPNWKRYTVPLDDGSDDIFENNDVEARRRVFPTDQNPYPFNEVPIQLNFALYSDEEGYYERTLTIMYVRTGVVRDSDGNFIERLYFPETLAEVNFYGVVIGQDERMQMNLDNHGRTLHDSDAPVFRETDIDEALPDYIYLNHKRKELLLQSEEIYPYIGSYKALVNALKFFGYQDIKLQEYYINLVLSTEKSIHYTPVDIPLTLGVPTVNPNYEERVFGSPSFGRNLFGSKLDTSVFQKTSRFGLTYPLNEVTDDVDEHGNQIVKDAFLYTNEEILIKLYGLKRILQERYLPHHARIINITGEGIYFAKLALNTWQNRTHIISWRKEDEPDFFGYPRRPYIKFLDRLINRFKTEEGEAIEGGLTLDASKSLLDYRLHTLSEFSKGGRIDYKEDPDLTVDMIREFYPTSDLLKKAIDKCLFESTCTEEALRKRKALSQSTLRKYHGQPVVLQVKDFEVKWKDMAMTWASLENLNAGGNSQGANANFEDAPGLGRSRMYSWKNLNYLDYYEGRWEVSHQTLPFCWKMEGHIGELAKVLLFLPYVGKYDVTFITRDMTNMPSISTKRGYFEVLESIPDIVAFGRFRGKGSSRWDSKTTWKSSRRNWRGSGTPMPGTWGEAKISWKGLDYRNYLDQDFVKDDELKSSPILDVKSAANAITLGGDSFFRNAPLWSQKKRNVLVLERPEETYRKFDQHPLLLVERGFVTVQGRISLPPGEKVIVYRKVDTTQFVLDKNNHIVIHHSFIAGAVPGKRITLHDQSKGISREFLVKDAFYDDIEKLIHITIEDDGSLYGPFDWTRMEFTGEDYIFTVMGVITYGSGIEDSVTSRIPVEARNETMAELATYSPFPGWYMDGGIYDLRHVVHVKSAQLDSNGNTLVALEKYPFLCFVTTGYKAYWAEDYDFDWALRFGNVHDRNWKNMEKLTWEDSYTHTWGMTQYHGSVNPGWVITKLAHNGTITIGGVIYRFDFGWNPDHLWMYLAAKELNETHVKYFQDFYYVVMEPDFTKGESWDKYIKAVPRYSVARGLHSFTYDGGVEGSSDSYPRLNFESWKEEYQTDAIDPIYNPVYRTLKEGGGSYTNPGNTSDIRNKFLRGIRGSFQGAETFIKTKDFTIPSGVSVFMTMEDRDHHFEEGRDWELWDEGRKVLLEKSDKPYMVWTFQDPGSYSVKVRIKDFEGRTRLMEKRGWISVVTPKSYILPSAP